jgi:thiol-disulfide isomerase/thioredoxin
LGSFRLKEDGSFESGFRIKEPGLYRLRIGMAAIWLLLEGGETMSLTASIDKNNIPTYEIKGSELSQEASTWVNNLNTNAIAKYVREQPNSKALLKLFLLGRLPIAQYMDEIKKIKSDVQARYPETELSKGLAMRIDQAEAQMNQATIMVGKPVPDIRLADPNGKNMALSELKGKVVLIDFWASWCAPCRRENPNVVKIYNKFKDKGFMVYSVSLDGLDDRQQLSMQSNPEVLKQQIEAKRQAWIQAIKDDGLIWPYHVSELRSWSSSVAQLYGVDAIPRTFLLDRNGVLRYVNLRGGELEAKIKELLG